jgi:hypothetical protein
MDTIIDVLVTLGFTFLFIASLMWLVQQVKLIRISQWQHEWRRIWEADNA